MRKSRYSESQIVDAVKRAESGVAVKGMCLELKASTATFYQWRSKYGGLEASDLKWLKELEAEDRRLKQMYDDNSVWRTVLNSRSLAKTNPMASTERWRSGSSSYSFKLPFSPRSKRSLFCRGA